MTDLSTLAHDQTYPCGALYVLATPIGNVADLSVRGTHVLKMADVVACEDTRNTAGLLLRYGLSKRLIAVHEHNEAGAAEGILARLRAGERVVLVSDAGTPAISDPGMRLVAAVREAGLPVVALPGPSAVVTALSVAGAVLLPSEGRFSFLGFLPNKAMQRESVLRSALKSGLALVMFEAPHRVVETVTALSVLAGERLLLVARELTKRFEQTVVMPAKEAPVWLAEDSHHCQGEFVLVLAGCRLSDDVSDEGQVALALLLTALSAQGISAKSQVSIAQQVMGLPKARVKEAVYARLNGASVD